MLYCTYLFLDAFTRIFFYCIRERAGLGAPGALFGGHWPAGRRNLPGADFQRGRISSAAAQVRQTEQRPGWQRQWQAVETEAEQQLREMASANAFEEAMAAQVLYYIYRHVDRWLGMSISWSFH